MSKDDLKELVFFFCYVNFWIKLGLSGFGIKCVHLPIHLAGLLHLFFSNTYEIDIFLSLMLDRIFWVNSCISGFF